MFSPKHQMENIESRKRMFTRIIDQRNSSRISFMNKTQHSCRTAPLFGNFVTCLVLVFACLHAVVSESSDEDSSFKALCEESLPECECDVYYEVTGLNCRNVSNFEFFSRMLSGGSLFKVNTTFQIFLSGTRVLPREFLNGLIVERLIIEDPETDSVEDGAFEGMLKLQRLKVQISSFKEIPDFSPVRGSLEHLNLDNSLLTSISGDQLKNLTNLRTVSFVNNSIQSISPDVFQGTENLLIFDLSINQLTSLPPNLFSSLKKLKKVVLSSNQLQHVNQLFATTHPMFIYLDHNNLTNLDSILHQDMHEVETLQLSYNPLSTISENSFNGKINNTRFLFLDHCLFHEFNASHFQDMHRLAALDLSYNLIEDITNQSIQFGMNVQLDFTGNRIKRFSGGFTKAANDLYLGKNLLTSVGRILQESELTRVNMAENQINALRSHDFRFVRKIIFIDLQGNKISDVHPHIFRRLKGSLTYLDLSRNQIRSLQGCLRHLAMLISLNLTGNLIESFEEGEFRGLVQLKDLHLKGNLITTLGNEVRRLDGLRNLIVSNNRISTLKLEMMPQNLEFLFLEGNPIQCNCQLLTFLQYLDSTSVKTDVSLCTASNQTSLLPSATCPGGCNCSCMMDGEDHFMSVDCSSIGLIELPTLFTNECVSTHIENCSSVVIHLLHGNHFSQVGPYIIADNIESLNFTNNHLQSLEGTRLPNNLNRLFLGNNNLRKLSPSVLLSLENLREVTLSGNPWFCDCESLSLKEWILLKSDIVKDANETRCGPESPELFRREIVSLTDEDICAGNTELPSLLAT